MTSSFRRPRLDPTADNGIVFRSEQHFSAWTFLGGLSKTVDGSLLSSFIRTDVDYRDPDTIHHTNLSARAKDMVSIRSSDNGVTWDESTLDYVFPAEITPEAIEAGGPQNYAAEGPVDFLDPDVLVATGVVPRMFRPESQTWIRISTDGGRSWRRPIFLPVSGFTSLSGQGSAIVRADGVCLVALVALAEDGWTRRPLIYGSVDGIEWNFICFMTSVIDDGQADSVRSTTALWGAHRYFYPRPLHLHDGRLLASMRSQRDPRSAFWTEIFDSEDGGRTWNPLSRVNDWGAPGDITELSDGRIVCVYGYRIAPQGIRYRVSEDGGRTWGSELILRDDGGSWDLGYPRVVETEPGVVLATYYFNSKHDPLQCNGGVRHIARTIFRP